MASSSSEDDEDEGEGPRTLTRGKPIVWTVLRRHVCLALTGFGPKLWKAQKYATSLSQTDRGEVDDDEDEEEDGAHEGKDGKDDEGEGDADADKEDDDNDDEDDKTAEG